MSNCKKKNFCRTCLNENLKILLDLGSQPLANSYHNNIEKLESYPLCLMLCDKCYHTQLSHIVNPDIMFKNYIYVSGTSHTLRKYFEWLATKIINETRDITPSKPKILELACNDGFQLDYFKIKGWETWGVDPAENLHILSTSKGHNVKCRYWGVDVANELNTLYDIILAQNVFAHLDDVDGFLEACKIVMKPQTKLYIQTSQCNMYNNNEFDTIYHEHLSFFSAKSMSKVVSRHGLRIEHICKTPIHGTSYLFTITFGEINTDQAKQFIKKEESDGRYNMTLYNIYRNNCQDIIQELQNVIIKYRSSGCKIIGYGAAAKGNTLLNWTNIKLDYIIDDNNLKQGLYTPGMNILIKNPKAISDENDNLVIIPLAWNFYDEIVNKILALRKECKETTVIKYFPKIEIFKY
jgi:2-polyprenyl-3-methyl-5-hydroxy-6-metoxy-1,4-benzoquinol methylase